MSKIVFGVKSDYLLHSEYLPVSVKDYKPKWYTDIKPTKIFNVFKQFQNAKTAKSCPSFTHIVDEGYVIFAPVDYLIKVNEDGSFYWHTPLDLTYANNNFPMLTEHPDYQLVNFLPDNTDIKKILKINLPLRVFTEKNYSCRVVPYPYTHEENWQPAYGVFHTDEVHEVNIQIAIKNNASEFTIKQGTPLCVYVPFKREKHTMKIVDLNTNEKWKARESKNFLNIYGNTKGYWANKFQTD
tara:strand:+ start:307 stop:1026 length:720 start_codon:yes stop_codon:yes gene_type:complete